MNTSLLLRHGSIELTPDYRDYPHTSHHKSYGSNHTIELTYFPRLLNAFFIRFTFYNSPTLKFRTEPVISENEYTYNQTPYREINEPFRNSRVNQCHLSPHAHVLHT